MKKGLVLVACVLCLFLNGCGGGSTPVSNQDSSPQSDSVVVETPSSDSEASRQISEEKGSVTLGGVNGNLYTNESLGITMEIPDGWYALDEDQRMEIIKAGMEIMAGGDDGKQKMLDLSLQQTLPLINAYEKNPLTTNEMNPNIQLSVEKLSLMNSVFIKSEDDYISAVKTQLQAIKEIEGFEVVYTFGETGDITLNDKNFRILSTQLELADGTVIVMQDYYIYLGKEYVYAGIATYYTEEQKEVLEASFGTLKIA